MITQDDYFIQEARRFFRCLHGGDAPGYLAIWAKQTKSTRWVPAKDTHKAAQLVTRLSNGEDIYVGVGLQPYSHISTRRGETKDVIAIPSLWADIDVRTSAQSPQLAADQRRRPCLDRRVSPSPLS